MAIANVIELTAKPVAASDRISPLVSVIIPVYQGERLIRGAVRSALNQTHRHLEIIVVDDGSTDATLSVLASVHDPRLRVLRQPNAGTAAARNLALAQARGAYIAFLDCDDRWLPEKIETEIRTLQSAGEPVAVAYSSYYAVDDRGRLLNPAPERRVGGQLLEMLLDGDDFLIPSACLFDRRIFDRVGGFKLDRFHEDHDLILRVAQQYPIYPTCEHLVVYRQSTSGKCRGILADFDRARAEELALISDFRGSLTATQLARLRQNVIRALYCRFLMYGFNGHARRLQHEVDLAGLSGTKKGILARLFAASGLNLLVVARTLIQGYHLALEQGSWHRRLAQWGLDLGYDDRAANGPGAPAHLPSIRRVCIAIPTFRRPELLKRLLAGLALQQMPPNYSVDVLVIDNDRHASARAIVDDAAVEFPCVLRYQHVPEPGLSVVRDFALDYARDRFAFLAMIDDDEYPQTEWLAELLREQERSNADVVIGPVPKQFAATGPAWLRSGNFYDLPSYPNGARIADGYSGNCLLNVAAVQRYGVSFDRALNLAGGEDMLFFRELQARGATMTYAARAVAFETIGAERLRASYLVKLSYRRGNTLTYCDRRLHGSFTGLTIRALKACGRLALGWATLVPLAVLRGRSGALGAVCNIAQGLGSLAGLLGHIYDGYKRVEPSSR